MSLRSQPPFLALLILVQGLTCNRIDSKNPPCPNNDLRLPRHVSQPCAACSRARLLSPRPCSRSEPKIRSVKRLSRIGSSAVAALTPYQSIRGKVKLIESAPFPLNRSVSHAWILRAAACLERALG